MKILVIEVNWLGDVLFSTPAIKALKKRFPTSSISCLVVPRVGEVLAGNPNTDEIMINAEDSLHKGLFGKLRLAGQLKGKRFDLAVLFHRSATRAGIAWMAGIPRRIGYGRPKQRLFLTEALAMPEKDSLHRVDYYLNIVKPLGCDNQDRLYEFFVCEEDAQSVDVFLRKEGVSRGDCIVCMNPGGNWGPKRWPEENFGRLADSLISDCKAKIIFTGSDQDLGLILKIKSKMNYEAIISAGRMSLKQSACLFKESNLVISGDSGPLHIAASQGANLVALFGPTSPAVTGPIGKGKMKIIQKDIGCCIPCYNAECSDNRCMRQIGVEEVFREARQFCLAPRTPQV